jgi:hypothetical protein
MRFNPSRAALDKDRLVTQITSSAPLGQIPQSPPPQARACLYLRKRLTHRAAGVTSWTEGRGAIRPASALD